jgi:hypothetical protein
VTLFLLAAPHIRDSHSLDNKRRSVHPRPLTQAFRPAYWSGASRAGLRNHDGTITQGKEDSAFDYEDIIKLSIISALHYKPPFCLELNSFYHKDR